jgi:hypothetical protein
VLAVVAKIASNTNTIEYPNTNPIAFLTVFDVLFSSLPAKYDIYTGSNGRIQGEIKLAIPSTNVNTYSIKSSFK